MLFVIMLTYAFDDIDKNNITKIDVEQRFDNLDDLKNEIKFSELLNNFDEIKEKTIEINILKEIHNLLENNLKYTVSTTEGQPPIRCKS